MIRLSLIMILLCSLLGCEKRLPVEKATDSGWTADQRGDAANNPVAQNYWGVMYAEGRGLARDDAKAVWWFKQAAAQGNANGLTNLGWMYAEGRGVTKDEAKAVQLYKQAAAQGEAQAQNNLGVMYAEGRGLAQDDAEAVRLFRQAAAQGKAIAYANLGQMYEQGRGVARDLAEAQRWLAKAVETVPPGELRDKAIQARDQVARQLVTNQAPAPQPASVTPPVPVPVSPSVPSRTMEAQRIVTAPLTQSLDSENIPLT